MTRRVLVSHRLPELRSGNAVLDAWVREHLQRFASEVFEQISYLTPETGLWTPVVRGSGTAGTYELATASGTYYRIGDIVFASVFVQFAAVVTAGGTGDLQITGIPFEKLAAATGSYYPPGAVIVGGAGGGIDVTAGAVSLSLGFNGATANSILVIQQSLDNAANTLLPIASVAANDIISGSIVYMAGDRTG